jgi:DNA polymerase sigma
MSYNKGNNEASSKGKFYQTKTVSDKNLPTGNNDLTLTLYLNRLIEQFQIQEIEEFITKEKPSSDILKTAIILLLKKYNLGEENFYKLLDLFLQAGASPDIYINYNSQDNPKINISEKDNNITLLMLGIILNDIDLINIVLKYNPNINQVDSLGRSAIIYAILYNQNDSTKILNLLIKNNANINFSLKIQLNHQLEYHSVFTLACYQDLPRITKCLIDNYVDVNFKTKPGDDTGLHICAKYGRENTLQVLLSCERINTEITNKDGKRAVELVPDNDKKNEIMKLFINYYNNMNNKKNNDNNINNFNFQQMNHFNQINQRHVNNININGNEQQNNNNINNNMINNINNNINNNCKSFINVKMMNKMHYVNNNNNEINLQKTNNGIEHNIFNDSSDISEEQEIKEKQNKNPKIFKKNNNIFPQINSIKLLNQKIYHNLLSKSNYNFNIEIPIEIIKKKNNFSEKFNTLNNFISPKLNSTPLLNLDITDKCFDLEIKLNELKSQIQEKDKKLQEYKLKSEEQKQIYEEKMEKLEKNNLEFNNIIKKIKENSEKIKKLEETQQELKNKIPQDKLYHQSNKDNKFYKDLKFMPHQIEDTEMFKILNKDLLDYQKYITEKINKKIPLISNMINEIKATLNTLTQDYDIQIYGSYANNLCMPWSDLDLVLVNKNANLNDNNYQDNNNNNENNNENILLEQNNDLQSDSASIANTDSTRETFNSKMENDYLIQLYYKLKNKTWIKQLILTENLSIKILRIIAKEAYSDMNIDISFDSEKHNGLKCVNLVKSYLKEYTVLKPITIALKAILQSANLHNPNKGGLSSYGLILMVVSYIQSQKENFGLKNEPDLIGKIFYGFLKHYGILFDFNKYLILTYPINETNYANNDKESFLNINQFSQEFIILDPLNNKNNVANSSFQFMNLKMAFMIAFMVTMEDCDCGCHYGKAVYENSFNSTEHSYLKRMLNSVRRFQG